MQEKYEEAMFLFAQMEKRAVMAETMLEATLQYESSQLKALSSPRYMLNHFLSILLFSSTGLLEEHQNLTSHSCLPVGVSLSLDLHVVLFFSRLSSSICCFSTGS